MKPRIDGLRVIAFPPPPPRDLQADELLRLFQTLDDERRELLLWWAERFSVVASEGTPPTLAEKMTELEHARPGAALVVEKLIDGYLADYPIGPA